MRQVWQNLFSAFWWWWHASRVIEEDGYGPGHPPEGGPGKITSWWHLWPRLEFLCLLMMLFCSLLRFFGRSQLPCHWRQKEWRWDTMVPLRGSSITIILPLWAPCVSSHRESEKQGYHALTPKNKEIEKLDLFGRKLCIANQQVLLGHYDFTLWDTVSEFKDKLPDDGEISSFSSPMAVRFFKGLDRPFSASAEPYFSLEPESSLNKADGSSPLSL